MAGIPSLPTDRVIYDQKAIYVDRDIEIFTMDGSEITINGYPITLVNLDGQRGDILVSESGSKWRLNKLAETAYIVQNGTANYTVQVGDKVAWFDSEGRFFVGKNILSNPTANSHRRLPDFMFAPMDMRFFTRSISLTTLNDPADLNFRRFGGDAPYGAGAADGTIEMLTGLGLGGLVGQVRGTPASCPFGGTDATPGGAAVSTGAVMSIDTVDLPRRATSDEQTSNAMAFEWNVCDRHSHDFREPVLRLSPSGNLQVGKKAVYAGDQGAVLQIRAYEGENCRQIITITNSPTNGTYKIKVFSTPTTDSNYALEVETTPLARNDNNTVIRNALVAAFAALPGNIGTTGIPYSSVTAADFILTGGPLPGTPVEVEFTGILGLMPQWRMKATNINMTGPSGDVTITIDRVGKMGVRHEKNKRLVDMQHTAGQTTDYVRIRDSASVNALTLDVDKRLIIGTSIQLTEMAAAPPAPAGNKVELYCEDNGAGKTRVMAQFATGAPVQVAIQP